MISRRTFVNGLRRVWPARHSHPRPRAMRRFSAPTTGSTLPSTASTGADTRIFPRSRSNSKTARVAYCCDVGHQNSCPVRRGRGKGARLCAQGGAGFPARCSSRRTSTPSPSPPRPLAHPAGSAGPQGRQACLRRKALQPERARRRAAGGRAGEIQEVRAGGRPAAVLGLLHRDDQEDPRWLIGEPYLAKAWYANTRAVHGPRQAAPVPENLNWDLWQGPAPRSEYKDNIHPYNWHWLRRYGTGETLNNGTHEVDVCRWALQADFPKT
jgi:hypothetical protein